MDETQTPWLRTSDLIIAKAADALTLERLNQLTTKVVNQFALNTPYLQHKTIHKYHLLMPTIGPIAGMTPFTNQESPQNRKLYYNMASGSKTLNLCGIGMGSFLDTSPPLPFHYSQEILTIILLIQLRRRKAWRPLLRHRLV